MSDIYLVECLLAVLYEYWINKQNDNPYNNTMDTYFNFSFLWQYVKKNQRKLNQLRLIERFIFSVLFEFRLSKTIKSGRPTRQSWITGAGIQQTFLISQLFCFMYVVLNNHKIFSKDLTHLNLFAAHSVIKFSPEKISWNDIHLQFMWKRSHISVIIAISPQIEEIKLNNTWPPCILISILEIFHINQVVHSNPC